MTYFGFLGRFVILPLLILRLMLFWDRKRGKSLPDTLQNWPEDDILLAHVAVAVAYTTPWDNYLVATDVWSYDRDKVTGFTLGWVPIEEYSFFVLQSLLTGTWLQVLARRIEVDESDYQRTYPIARLGVTSALGWLWWRSVRSMIRGRSNDTYRDLILSWSLLPVMIQTAFGSDILWRHRKLIATALVSSTAYLGVMDSIAIRDGIWSISGNKTTGQHVIPYLPSEELLFFFMTNVLLTFGVTLVQAKESENRFSGKAKEHYLEWKETWLKRRNRQ